MPDELHRRRDGRTAGFRRSRRNRPREHLDLDTWQLLLGFAGPRVIEQTIGETLPAGFQRSEFQLEHGFVDKVVPRSELRATLIQLLQLHAEGGRRND